jgi:hypothetical protein
MSINSTNGNGDYTLVMSGAKPTGVILSLASSARATYSSGLLSTDLYDMISLDISVTAITGGLLPTVAFRLSRQGADGVLYPIFTTAAISVAGIIPPISIGPSSGVSQMFGDQIQLDMLLTGSPTSVTFSASIKGK